MVVENNFAISANPIVAGRSPANNANALKTPHLSQDSVEISSKKGVEKKSDWKKTAKVVLGLLGLATAGAMIGAAIQRRYSLPKPDKMKNFCEEIIKRPLTDAEKTRIDEKCRKAKRNDNFFMDIIDTLILWT